MSDKYHDSEETTAARLMFDMAGVAFRKFTPKCSKIATDFDSGPARSFSESHPIKLPGDWDYPPPGSAFHLEVTPRLPVAGAAHEDAHLNQVKPHLLDSPITRNLHLIKLLI